MNEVFSEAFAKNFHVQNIQKCQEVLDEWQLCEPDTIHTIQGLRATIALIEGKLNQSIQMMENALNFIEGTIISLESAQTIRYLYQQVINFNLTEQAPICFSKYDVGILLCGGNQPRGLKLKYWFGVGQIITACLIAPFNPPAAIALASSGFYMTFDAACDALDNKDQWERELNARQRIN